MSDNFSVVKVDAEDVHGATDGELVLKIHALDISCQPSSVTASRSRDCASGMG